MATQFTNRVKMTAWAPDMKMEFDGSRTSAIALLFRPLKTQDARSKVLSDLHNIDAEMTTKAAAKAQADAAQG